MPHYVRLGGLPYQLTNSRVSNWLKDNGVAGGLEVHLLINRDNRPAGMGFAVLENGRDADAALELDGLTIGDTNRYVKIYRSDQSEFQWYLDRQKRQQHHGGEALHLVRLRGVPFKVNEYEIAQWFGKVSAECVDVQCGTTRSTQGLANAYFRTVEEARRAMKMDKEHMEGRYIELSMDQVTVTFDREASGGEHSLRMMGVPYRTTEQELKDFFRPSAECVDVKVVLNREGVPSGDAIATFASEEAVQAALSCDKKNLGSRYVVLQRSEKNGFPSSAAAGAVGSQHASSGGGGSGGNGSHRHPFSIKMNGLPYEAGEQDVMDFFKSVAACTNVRILTNRGGLPSGEAIASFATKEDVDAALTKNRDYIGSRYVILSPYD